MDSSVPLTHHDQKDLGTDLFSEESQKPFSDSFGFKNPILHFLTETHPQLSFYYGICLSNNIALAAALYRANMNLNLRNTSKNSIAYSLQSTLTG